MQGLPPLSLLAQERGRRRTDFYSFPLLTNRTIRVIIPSKRISKDCDEDACRSQNLLRESAAVESGRGGAARIPSESGKERLRPSNDPPRARRNRRRTCRSPESGIEICNLSGTADVNRPSQVSWDGFFISQLPKTGHVSPNLLHFIFQRKGESTWNRSSGK